MFANTILPLLDLLYALEYCHKVPYESEENPSLSSHFSELDYRYACPICLAPKADSNDSKYRGHKDRCALAIEINHLIDACRIFNDLALEQMPVSDTPPS